MDNTALSENRSVVVGATALSFVKAVLRGWLSILLCGLFFFCAGFVYKTESYHPRYSSSATFLVSDKSASGTAYSNLSTATTLAGVFQAILSSTEVQTAAAKSIGVPSFPGSVEATQITGNPLIEVTVTASSPITAYRALEALVLIYPQFSEKIMGNAVMDIFVPATVNVDPINSDGANLFSLIAFAGGAALMIAIIVFRSYINDNVKDKSDIKKKINTSLYVSIPNEKKRHTFRRIIDKRGTSLLVNNIARSFAFVEAYKRLRTKVEREQSKKGYKVFVVVSTNGNEGKSTTSANLAITLAEKDNRVLLIDSDLRKPAVYKVFDLGVEGKVSISEYLRGEFSPESAIYHLDAENIDVVVEYKNSSDAPDLISSPKMLELIEYGRANYDYVIIDTSPLSIISDAEDLVDTTDAVIVVIRQDFSSVKAVNRTVMLMSQGKAEVLGCVFNAVSIGLKHGGYGYGGYGYGGYGYGYGYGYGDTDRSDKHNTE